MTTPLCLQEGVLKTPLCLQEGVVTSLFRRAQAPAVLSRSAPQFRCSSRPSSAAMSNPESACIPRPFSLVHEALTLLNQQGTFPQFTAYCLSDAVFRLDFQAAEELTKNIKFSPPIFLVLFLKQMRELLGIGSRALPSSASSVNVPLTNSGDSCSSGNGIAENWKRAAGVGSAATVPPHQIEVSTAGSANHAVATAYVQNISPVYYNNVNHFGASMAQHPNAMVEAPQHKINAGDVFTDGYPPQKYASHRYLSQAAKRRIEALSRDKFDPNFPLTKQNNYQEVLACVCTAMENEFQIRCSPTAVNGAPRYHPQVSHHISLITKLLSTKCSNLIYRKTRKVQGVKTPTECVRLAKTLARRVLFKRSLMHMALF